MITSIKNYIIKDKPLFNSLLYIINKPVLGDIYDFFYFRMIKYKVKNSDPVLTIEPNNICNLRCKMCPYDRMTRKKETMSMNLFMEIIDQAYNFGCRTLQLQQYNEPFTDKLIFERIRYARNKGMSVKIYSNATLLNKKLRNALLETPPDIIRFSVDGFYKKTFESIRINANYEIVVNNIISLLDERNKAKINLPRIEVYCTALEDNRSEIGKIVKFWKNKCDNVGVYPADSREAGEYVFYSFKNKKPYPCYDPKNIIILSNGNVVMCCVDVDGKFVLGDLKKQKLEDIMKSERVKNLFLSHLKRNGNLKMCKDCSKQYIDSAFSWW